MFISLASKLAHWKTIRLAETQTKFLEHCMNKVHRFLHVNFTILAGSDNNITLDTLIFEGVTKKSPPLNHPVIAVLFYFLMQKAVSFDNPLVTSIDYISFLSLQNYCQSKTHVIWQTKCCTTHLSAKFDKVVE